MKPNAKFMGEVDDRGNIKEYIPGVPARDLNADEWAALPDDLKSLCVKSGLYVVKSNTEKPAGKDGEED